LFPNGAFEKTFAHTGPEMAKKWKINLVLNFGLEMNIIIVGSVNLKAHVCNEQCKNFSDM
jgi:hypothetical protein